MAKTPTKYNNGVINWLAKSLLGGNADPELQAAYKAFGGRGNVNPIYDDSGAFTGKFGLNSIPDGMLKDGATYTVGEALDPSLLSDKTAKLYKDTYNAAKATQNIDNGVSLGQLGKLGAGAISNHPFKAMGMGALGLGNIGGLTDNDKFGGQIAGLGLGGLGAGLAGEALGPYGKVMLTLGGGELGSLFDKLRAKKEQEQAMGYANAGNPVAMMNRR